MIDEKFKIETTLEHDFEIVGKRIQECEDFLNGLENLEMAQKLYETLTKALRSVENLDRTGTGRLYKDFAPLSFGFYVNGFQGGIIFHGPADGFGSGSSPTFSVCLEPTFGWSIHT